MPASAIPPHLAHLSRAEIIRRGKAARAARVRLQQAIEEAAKKQEAEIEAAEGRRLAEDAEACRASLSKFVRAAWPIVEPAPFVGGMHIDAICLHLEAVTRGEIRRLLVTVPPRHSKSLIVSVLWPAWIWISRPEWRSLFVSHSSALSVEHSRLCRQLIESDWYQERLAKPGGWALAEDQNAKDDYQTTRGGRRASYGITSKITGHGGDLVVVDDPLADADALSEAARNEAKRIIGRELPVRLNDQRTGRMVMIMQRLHDDDPAAFVLSGGLWEHLCLPTEFEIHRRSVTYRIRHQPEGAVREELWRDPRTQEGELLNPARFPREVVEELKSATVLGASGFEAKHQQRPSPEGGGLFKKADWRFWKPDGTAPSDADGMIAQRPRGCYSGPANPRPFRIDRLVISVDGTFKETTSGSFVAIHVWGASGSRRLLLDRVHARMDYDATEQALVGMRSRGREYPIGGVLGKWSDYELLVVEDKANGSALVKRLSDVLGIPRVIAESVNDGNKQQRASVFLLPYVRAGNVELPDGAPWLDEYVGEHAAFPMGRHNDDVDAGSQALKVLGEESSLFDTIANGRY